MHFRNNSNDFWNWCRHYIKRAREVIKVHENINDANYQIRNKKYYDEAKEILRQHETLKHSLNNDQNELLEECLIKGIVKPKYSDYNVNNNLMIIKSNWRKICFPNTKQKLKTINKSEIGKFLKQERLFQGWSLKFVAELTNISEVTLKSYEDGNRLFRLDVIYKLTQIYDMSIDELIKNK